MDAGGGTVDATVYQVKKEYPLRLSAELTTPEGPYSMLVEVEY
jgi:hypothetical protein